MRVLTINVWNKEGPALDRLSVLLSGIGRLKPDVIALQEVCELPGGNHADRVARVLPGDWVFPDPGANGYGPAIASSYPVQSSTALRLPSDDDDPRFIVGTELVIPEVGVVPFYSTHLSWKGDQSARREEQVQAIDELIRSRPADRPAIVCGDFNCVPDSAPIWFMTGRMSLAGKGAAYHDAWATHARQVAARHPRADVVMAAIVNGIDGMNRHGTHHDTSEHRPRAEPGYTWSARNPYLPRDSELDRRLDYIFTAPGWRVKACGVVLDEPSADVWPSDHFGVLADLAI